MARGATKTGENMAQGQVAASDAALNTAQTQAGQAYSQLMPQITQMLSPGGSPAVTAATMGALGSKFGAAKQDVMDTAARTNNGASTNAALDKLATTEGTESAQAAANNAENQQSTADKLLASIYGQNTELQPALLNAGTGAVNAYSTAAKTGNQFALPLFGRLLSGLGGGAGALAQA